MVMKAEDAEDTQSLGSDDLALWGALREGVHIAGYSFERACRGLETLLEGERWKLDGRFGAVEDFMRSLGLDKLRGTAEERKRIAQRIKELQPDVTNRAISRGLGVHHSTIDEDLGGNPPPKDKNANENNDQEHKVGGNPPPLSGAEVAVIATAEELKRQRREQNAALKAEPAPPVPEGKFSTIIIDPPWPMVRIEREVAPYQVDFDYPTMSEDELRNFVGVIDDLAAPDCHLFMWTTQKFLPLGLTLLDWWRARYVLTMVWHKPGGFQPFGLPQYNCEFVLYGRMGCPEFIDIKAFNCCFQAPRREHSRKPDEFYELIRRVTGAPRIDIFSREPRSGFAQFGNEAEKFAGAE